MVVVISEFCRKFLHRPGSLTLKMGMFSLRSARSDISGGTMAGCVPDLLILGRFAYDYEYVLYFMVLYGTGYDSTHERYV